MKSLVIMYLKSLLRNRSLLILLVLTPIVVYPLIYWGITQYFMVKKGFEDHQKIDLVLQGDKNNNNVLNHLKNLTDSLQNITQVNNIYHKPIKQNSNYITIKVLDYKTLPQYEISIDSTNSMTLSTFNYIRPKLEEYYNKSLSSFKKNSNKNDKYYDVCEIKAINISHDNEVLIKILSMIIPMFAIISVLSGVAAAAVEVTAGERENNAYETVFVTSLKRSVIHNSKIIATFIFGFFSGLLHFFMLSSIMIQIMGIFLKQFQKNNINLDIESIFSLKIIILVILTLCIVGLLSSLLFVTISSFSPSKKEANIALTPVIALMMYISIVIVVPALKPTILISLVPILNLALSLKLFISNNYNYSFFYQTLFSTFLHIFLVYKFLVPMLFSEDIIFGNTKEGFLKNLKKRYKK